jgi:hypothetical protein
MSWNCDAIQVDSIDGIIPIRYYVIVFSDGYNQARFGFEIIPVLVLCDVMENRYIASRFDQRDYSHSISRDCFFPMGISKWALIS